MKKGKKNRQRARRYNLIVIPDNRARVWRWGVSRNGVEAVLVGCLAIVLVLVGSIWGFAHYRSAYIATEDVRLENARVEQERSELLSKLATLEQVVERTERFVGRLEATIGLSSEEIQKGIGPVAESEFSQPISVKRFDALKYNRGNSIIAFSDLDFTLDELQDKVSGVDERLHAVYELHEDRMTYWASVPSIWPARGWITSDFGSRRRPIRGGTTFHKGIDIAAPPGTPILCPGDGIVTFAGYRSGLGKTIMIDHGYGVVSVYGHNAENYVKEGDRVKRGEILGGVGRTGLATGSHLHYQIEVDGIPVDPMRYIHSYM